MTILALLIVILLFIFVVGLCVGSFLNVVILRAFSNESIAYPASKCPLCQKPLKWYHNIPVISYLCLSGKCAFCKEKISIQYPIVELVTGFLFVALFIKFGFGFNALFMFAFTSLFVVLAVTDIKEKVVFDVHTITLVILGLVYNFFNFGNIYTGQKIFTIGALSVSINHSFLAAIFGLIIGILIMEALARFGYLVAGTRAFGEGDTYIAAALGAIFGWQYLITILVYSFIIQIVLTIPVFLKKLWIQKDTRTLIAFVAFSVYLTIFKIVAESPMISNMLVYGVMVLILTGLGIYLCKRILTGLKKQENLTYLPFGPAMVFAAFIVMFMI